MSESASLDASDALLAKNGTIMTPNAESISDSVEMPASNHDPLLAIAA